MVGNACGECKKCPIPIPITTKYSARMTGFVASHLTAVMGVGNGMGGISIVIVPLVLDRIFCLFVLMGLVGKKLDVLKTSCTGTSITGTSAMLSAEFLCFGVGEDSSDFEAIPKPE